MADPYVIATAIRTVLIDSLSQFVSDDAGSNIGIGYSGWDESLAYARENGLDYFGSIFLATGDDEMPKAFQYGMWRWAFYIRLHVKFDKDASPSSDQNASNLASDFMDALLNTTNVYSISSDGMVKVVAANYLGEPETVNDVSYLTIEFLVAVKVQISRS